ncbi:NusG domain II-containing protein [uncultured Oscillibacter sp.]|uniref:NusG domain II-containing protein n=1 Tax=uncultured Oscillibacter sp. TaxID=876091 RepID=UPI0025E4B606|nr:NusG domain II-containing protein [uncultured Oscillibacter sp.]
MFWKSSPKLRPNGWDALVVLAVIALAAGSALAVWRGAGTARGPGTVIVTIDGREADRFPLSNLLEAPRTYSNNGYTLELVYGLRGMENPPPDHREPFGEAGVRAAWADCPTQDCVRTGLITRGGQSIVCLPARIIVQLTGTGAEDGGGVDAVLG